MQKTEREKLVSELQTLNTQLMELKKQTEDPEVIATINNILTPVRYAIEDIIESEGKQFARYVIAQTRERIIKLEIEQAPDTIKSF